MAAGESHQQRVARIFDAASDGYDAGIGLFERFGKCLVETAGLQPGERVLDLACGSGASLVPAAAAVGPSGEAHGVDLSPLMVERCHAELRQAGHHGHRATVMDAEELTFDDGRFDAVLCGFGVFFFSEPGRVVADIRRVLTPRGRFVFTLFDGPVLWEWLNPTLLAYTPPPHPAPHPMWTRDGATQVLKDGGFGSVQSHEVKEELVVADIDVLWSWLWALGSRMLLERMDANTLEALRRELADRLEEHRFGDRFVSRQRAVVVVAERGERQVQ